MSESAPAETPAAEDADQPLQRELRDTVAVLTMTYRPHNLLGPTLGTALIEGIRWAEQSGARAILLRSGLRHFCAGADVTLFRDRIAAGGIAGRFNGLELLDAFEGSPLPIVSAVHGVCLGGGFELALATDYIIAADSAKIGSVEAALGLHPLMGGIQRQAQRAGMHRAKELAMLARRYDPATLERWNLVNLVVAEDDLARTAWTVVEELAHGPTVAHGATKELARIAVNQGVAAADAAMAEVQKRIWESEDLRIGLASFAAEGPGMATFVGR